MSRWLVARREGRWLLAGRLWTYALLFAVAGALLGALAVREAGPVVAFDLASESSEPLAVLVPAAGVLFGADAVAGERERGTIRLLLVLPFERVAIVEGKAVARGLTFAAMAAAAPLSGLAVAALLGGVPALGTVGLFVALTALFGLVVASLAVGASAAVGTSTRALALTFGGFVGLLVWRSAAPNLVSWLLTGESVLVYPYPWWATFVERLTPMGAYEGAVAALGPSALRTGGDLPLALSPWVAVAVLVAWGVFGLAVGRRRFRRADI